MSEEEDERRLRADERVAVAEALEREGFAKAALWLRTTEAVRELEGEG